MHDLSAFDLHSKFLKKEISASEITRATFGRIREKDPIISAFLSTFEMRAQKKAEELDERRASGKPLGKLAGVPIALKDNIHVRGETTTCASKFLENYKAVFDATVTRLLEEEDALVVGKTNLDEFAMGSSTENSAYQITKNPWDLKRSPGGSSGGSAAAVAARLCPLALGSDTGGSIRQPASLCGIVGFKPTYGRVSRYGLVAFASSLDQIGPFATTVEDAAYLSGVIGKHCPHDSTSLNVPQEDYLSCLKNPIKNSKIGVPWKLLETLSEEVRHNFEETLEALKSLGAEIIDVDLSLSEYATSVYYILATAEASTNLARFDGIRYGARAPEAKTLDEVYLLSKGQGFGAEVKRRILLGTYVLSSGYQDAYYKQAQKVRTLIINQCERAFKQCDIIALPTSPTPAFEIGRIADPLTMYLQDIYTIPANLAGLPALSLPSGYNSQGLPFSIQLMAPQGGDARLLNHAFCLEQTLKVGKIPPLFDLETR